MSAPDEVDELIDEYERSADHPFIRTPDEVLHRKGCSEVEAFPAAEQLDEVHDAYLTRDQADEAIAAGQLVPCSACTGPRPT